MSRQLPKWLVLHVQKCREAFGIGHAGFECIVRRDKAPGGKVHCLGFTEPEPRYERAVVTIRADVTADDLGYEVLTHELLHAALGAEAQAITSILHLVPKAQRKHALHLWTNGNEAAVTRLARGLTPVLRTRTHKEAPTMGGKPSKSTPKDKRLKENKTPAPMPGKKAFPGAAPPFRKKGK